MSGLLLQVPGLPPQVLPGHPRLVLPGLPEYPVPGCLSVQEYLSAHPVPGYRSAHQEHRLLPGSAEYPWSEYPSLLSW